MASNGQQQGRSKIDVLLNLVPDSPSTVLAQLEAQPDLASAQDAFGYSLLHAASSYAHTDLLRALVQTYNASPNITDEDNETPLFAAESQEVAQCLLDLGADIAHRNAEGLTAEEKIEGESEFPLVAAFLRQHASTAAQESSDSSTQLGHPPPMPNGVKVNIGTMLEPLEGDAPDPELRRRIEELAARPDFDGEEAQEELRKLITDAVGGMRERGDERNVRRRLDD
jgi:ankyrin repeat protein